MKSHKDQLSEIRGKLSNTSVGRFDLPFSPTAWQKEGRDHINLSSVSNKPLGRLLSLRNGDSFTHPLLGNFKSLNNLWYFLKAKTPSEALRSIAEHPRLKQELRDSGGESRDLSCFRAMFMHSAYLRILGNESLLHEMIQSDLPFDCYRVIRESGLPIRFDHSAWFCGAYEEIRLALKERREPRLNYLVTGPQPKNGIYFKFLAGLFGAPEKVGDCDLTAWVEKRWARYDNYVNRKKENAEARRREREAAREKAEAEPDAEPEVVTPTIISGEVQLGQVIHDPKEAECETGAVVESHVDVSENTETTPQDPVTAEISQLMSTQGVAEAQ